MQTYRGLYIISKELNQSPLFLNISERILWVSRPPPNAENSHINSAIIMHERSRLNS